MVQTKLTRGHIFDIQGFSVHDGPGCRTLIFFKGCSLECAWCSNPEGISFLPEPLWRESKCTFDGLCLQACPHGAITISKNGNANRLTFNRSVCAKCTTHDCAKACCSGALNIGGYEISAEDLFARISRDRQYWGASGGITLTGGEPFAQPDFACNFLKRCHDAYIHTAAETCGNVPWENYEKALPYLDWIFFDLKTMNESGSCQITRPPVHLPTCPLVHLPASPPLSLILCNARRLAREFPGRLIFRMPLVPRFNDDEQNIRETARFIHATGRDEINILPLHHLGREKYNLLGKQYYTHDFIIPTRDNLQIISDQFRSEGIRCYTGSDTPF
jgi:pyruvate formate lyase activating enzyme